MCHRRNKKLARCPRENVTKITTAPSQRKFARQRKRGQPVGRPAVDENTNIFLTIILFTAQLKLKFLAISYWKWSLSDNKEEIVNHHQYNMISVPMFTACGSVVIYAISLKKVQPYLVPLSSACWIYIWILNILKLTMWNNKDQHTPYLVYYDNV